MNNPTKPITLDLGSSQGETVAVAGYDSLALRAEVVEGGPTTAVVAVRRSLTGEIADAVDFTAPITLALDGSISAPIDVRELHAVHLIPTTTDAGHTALITGTLITRS